MSILPSSAAVQERMRELREKEAAAKADAELLQQKLVEGIKREVETKAVEWEADLLFEIEKTPGFTIWLRKSYSLLLQYRRHHAQLCTAEV